MRLRVFVDRGTLIVAMAASLWACDAAPPASTLVRPDPPANLQPGAPLPGVAASTLFEDLTARARWLAAAAYEPPPDLQSEALGRLDYDQYRAIRFRPEAAVWHNRARFEVQLFHPGFVHRHPVQINLVHDGQIAALPFDHTLFRYDEPAAAFSRVNTAGLGYAGFRIHYPLNEVTIKDEVVVFLGASYFRLLGPGHVYGLSSRGLGVDTGLQRAEEFPRFREFWLHQPAPDDDRMTINALLDSPSVTGAYQFVLTTAPQTTMDVEARLFARRTIEKLGVAPMSSMFLYGPNRIPRFDDYRPQVHDSDGLLVHAADGEWVWRPLSNGPGVQVTAFRGGSPRGFGLVQRDRRFDGYLDAEARYDRRPSQWVEPGDGDWGPGRVELLSYASVSEFNDNIAAYWVPDEPVAAGDARRFRYRLLMFDDRVSTQSLAQAARTRVGWDALPGEQNPPPRHQRRFVVDFTGDASTIVTAPPAAVLETTTGEVGDLVVQQLPEASGWRASFRLVGDPEQSAVLSLYLVNGERRLSETWSYVWNPEHVQE